MSRIGSRQIVLAVLFILATSTVLRLNPVYGTTATVQVVPTISSVNIGQVFSVNITVTDVSNLYAWEFRVYFLKGIINCTAATEGPFLNSAGTTIFLLNITNNYNSTYGRVLAACTLLGAGKSVSGSGTLATLTFNATANGSSNLDLQETKLSDINSQSIPSTEIGGRVRVGQGGTVHDLTVVNVVSLRKTVGKGYLDNITVTVLDSGDFAETFNVTLRLNGTDINTKESTLPSGGYTSMIFTWNTTGFAYGIYNVSAYAWPVANETNTADNTKIDGSVTVSIVGDINGDGAVDIYDAIQLASAFNTNPSSSNWNPNADLNSDGTVDIYDAIMLANNFNKHL
jgi:hypothetical protein